MQGLRSTALGSMSGDFVGPDAAARNRIGDAAGLQSSRSGAVRRRNPPRSAATPLVRDAVLFPVLVHQPGALDAQPGLGDGLVVDPTVDHPGCGRSGVAPDRVRVRHHRVGPAPAATPRHRQPHDAGATTSRARGEPCCPSVLSWRLMSSDSAIACRTTLAPFPRSCSRVLSGGFCWTRSASLSRDVHRRDLSERIRPSRAPVGGSAPDY